MSLDTDAASSELRIRGLAEHILADSGIKSSAEFRRQGQFRRQGTADPNSGVGNSSAEFRRQGQFRRQGPADSRPTRIPASGTLAPNSGVRGNLGVRDRRTRIQAQEFERRIQASGAI